MKSSITNPVGNWDAWPEEILHQFQSSEPTLDVGHRIIHEDQKQRVWTITLAPGEVIGFHRHQRPYLYTAISAGHSRSYYHDGSIHEAEYEIGDCKTLLHLKPDAPHIHNLENIGDTELSFITVEFLE